MSNSEEMEEQNEAQTFGSSRDGPHDDARAPLHIPPHTSRSTNPIVAEMFSNAPSSAQPATPAPTSNVDRRRSMQLPGENSRITPFSHPGRKSTQITRPDGFRRPSHDFDNRRDGPYGRPSITMVRRRSTVPDLAADPRDDHEAIGMEHRREDGITNVQSNSSNPSPTTGNHSSPPTGEPGFEPEPPTLNYSLWPRKWSILIFWTLILIDCIAMPIALYYALHYHTSLSPNAVFSIVTAALGGVSILEYVVRAWRLWKKDSTCRVIGASRWYFDWFHWNFSFGWVVIIIELIVGTCPRNPPIRLLAMPCASMLYAFGTELLIVDILRYFQVPAPVRISSIPKGAQLRPCVYSVIEDICAVDGSGGTVFREALNKRYEASHVFRAMLRRLGLFWAIGAETMAVVLTILIFTIDAEAAYVVGWSAPFVWAGIWTAITIFYVKRKLKEEAIAWAEELAAKEARV